MKIRIKENKAISKSASSKPETIINTERNVTVTNSHREIAHELNKNIILSIHHIRPCKKIFERVKSHLLPVGIECKEVLSIRLFLRHKKDRASVIEIKEWKCVKTYIHNSD